MGLDLDLENLEEDISPIIEKKIDRAHISFHPDSSFNFQQANVEKIRSLLYGLNQENFASTDVSQLGIFDVFTNIIIEALQFLSFIPYSIENDIAEIEDQLKVQETRASTNSIETF